MKVNKETQGLVYACIINKVDDLIEPIITESDMRKIWQELVYSVLQQAISVKQHLLFITQQYERER